MTLTKDELLKQLDIILSNTDYIKEGFKKGSFNYDLTNDLKCDIEIFKHDLKENFVLMPRFYEADYTKIKKSEVIKD
ncbi:MAG: hypothetical protein GTO02_07870 [Candidatus Dadabacteria bacterium]|nr:hypothetical protein [Candidatus Dadabacteria bacterium]